MNSFYKSIHELTHKHGTVVEMAVSKLAACTLVILDTQACRNETFG